MIEFPESEKELSQLEQFISAAEQSETFTNKAELLECALEHYERLAGPVTIGFAGEFGAGKSSLANMLAGADVLPTGPNHLKLPLVIVNYAVEPETTLGWWDRESVRLSGIVLEKAAAQNPDFISIGLPSEALQQVSLFDMPGTGADPHDSARALELLDLVDCAIWCTNATNSWRESERDLWFQVAPDLRKNALLVVTHADLPAVRDNLDRIMGRAQAEAADMFQTIVSIGTPEAIQAMSQEPEPDFELWQSCGGDGLAQALLDVAMQRRLRDVETARNDLQTRLMPALEALDQNTDEPSQEESQTAAEPSLQSVLQEVKNPLLEAWLSEIDSVYQELREKTDMPPEEFLKNCHDIVEDFAERLDDQDNIHPDATWVPAEFEKATDLLLLLQFEHGPNRLRDAVSILKQLSDNLAWAGSQAK